jgi:hypothetical protein
MRFGLLIILIALVIIAVLYMGKGPQKNPVAESSAKLDEAKGISLEPILRQVEGAIDAYADENGGYPAELKELVPRFLPGNDSLVDPWGSRLRLERNERQQAFLISAGPDRKFSTGDDRRRSL